MECLREVNRITLWPDSWQTKPETPTLYWGLERPQKGRLNKLGITEDVVWITPPPCSIHETEAPQGVLLSEVEVSDVTRETPW